MKTGLPGILVTMQQCMCLSHKAEEQGTAKNSLLVNAPSIELLGSLCEYTNS